MSRVLEVRVPDVGGVEDVDVVEILVAPGQRVAKDEGLIVLGTDKASMDLPAPAAGTVQEIKVALHAKVKEGDLVLTLAVEDEDQPPVKGEAAEPEETTAPAPPPEPVRTPTAAEEPATKDDSRAAAATPAPAPAAAPRETRPAAGPRPGNRLLVLGSGPGGYTAAFRAADLGLEVTLVERYPALGGVCLNVGCIPSKALLHAAKVIDEAADFGAHGIRFAKPEIDLPRLAGWKQAVVDKMTGNLATLAKRRGVTVVHGTGRFVGPHALEVATADGPAKLSFDQAIVAVGSRVARLAALDLDDPRVMDSTAALELDEVPARLLVVGGGIIGLEMACVYSALGSRVTVVELTGQLIPECDADLVKPLAKRLADRYDAILLETKVTRLEAKKEGLVATFEGASAKSGDAPASGEFDRVLVAVGRRPNGDQINAQAAGLEVTDRGFVPVDRQMRTNVPHIFAIGDVARPPMLAHKAQHEAKVAAEAAAGEKSFFDARVIPSVAYTDPEIAWVGLTEKEAKDKGVPYEKTSFPWAASGRAMSLARTEGTTKLLFDPATRRILGAGTVGPNAGDLISEAALAIEMGADAADLALTIHPHPTLSESIAMAAEMFEGTVTDLYLPRKKR